MSSDDGEEEEVKELSLDEQLIEASIQQDLPAMIKAVENGASAKFNMYKEGVWGAYEQYSAIHKVLSWKTENRMEALEFLLKNGADVNAQYGSSNWKGSGSSGTAFERALGTGDSKVIQLFLQYGADANVCQSSEAHTMRYDGSSKFPFIYISAKRGNLELIKCLLEHHADPNIFGTNRGSSEYGPIDDTKELAIHAACDYFCRAPEESKENAREIIRQLLKYGTDVNSYGRKVYQVAVERNVSEDDQEANDPRSGRYVPSTRNVRIRYTPIHIAINMKNEELYNILLSNGANPSHPYFRDNIEIQTLDFMKEKEVEYPLSFEWSISNHSHLPHSLKIPIQTLQMCSTHLNLQIGVDALSIIYNFLCWDEFNEKDSTFAEFRKKEQDDHKQMFW